MAYVYNPQPVRGNGPAIAALITGLIGVILTVVTGWIPIVGFFLILLPALLAIIFGFIGRSQARAGAGHGTAASAGLACGFVAILLTGLMQVAWGMLIGGAIVTAVEVSEDPEVIEEVQKVTSEVQRRVQEEWERMNHGRPELEIEIVDPPDEAAEPLEMEIELDVDPGQKVEVLTTEEPQAAEQQPAQPEPQAGQRDGAATVEPVII